jgi:hypothetical protein
MAELNKRLNAGWVLRDCIITSDSHTHYYLFRGKSECEIEIKPNGYGFIYTSSRTVRI